MFIDAFEGLSLPLAERKSLFIVAGRKEAEASVPLPPCALTVWGAQLWLTALLQDVTINIPVRPFHAVRTHVASIPGSRNVGTPLSSGRETWEKRRDCLS